MQIHLERITLKSGDEISLTGGLTAIVGPNNVGKSLLLRELQARLNAAPGQSLTPERVLDSTQVTYTGTAEEFMQWLEKYYRKRPPGQWQEGILNEPSFRTHAGAVLLESHIMQYWGSQDRLGPLGSVFVQYLGAVERLSLVGNSGSFNPLLQQPTNVVQSLFADRALEEQVSSMMQRAFGVGLTVNRYGGSDITLHVGKVEAKETQPPISQEYIQELSSLPQLQEQGDGIRAFVGMLLSATITRYPLVVIDEPEAFLHPPQAYLFGQVLAEQQEQGTQILIATHSEDIIAGLTSIKAAAGDVSIVRLTRSGKSNHVAQVRTEVVGELYKDPLIKYHNILGGLFSQGVLLCEGDSDCTYYRAVFDALKETDKEGITPALTVHFTHCGGKARMPKAVAALRSAKVPVVCAVDIDVLQEDREFAALVTACGGDPEKYKAMRNIVTNAVAGWSTSVQRVSAQAKVEHVFSGKSLTDLTPGEVAKIKEAVSPRSGWKEFKKHGASHLSGEAVGAFERLDHQLRRLGIFLVPVGELERFHRDINADNKAVWLQKVLESDKYLASEEARDYVTAIAAAIASAQ